MNRRLRCIYTILVVTLASACGMTTPVPITTATQTSVPTFTFHAPSATLTLTVTPTVVPVPSRQISAGNFSKLINYTLITFPEKVSKILWLSNGDKLGLFVDDRIRLYTVPSFLPDGALELPRRRSIYSITHMRDFGDVMLINQDGSLLLWSLFKNKSIRSYAWPNTDLISAQVSPSSNLIARSGVQINDRKRVIEIIDLYGNVIQKLIGHKNDAPVLDFSPDEKIFVTSASGRDSSQNMIFVWDIFLGELLYSLPESTRGGAVVKFNHTGNRLVIADGDSVRLWNVSSENWTGDDWKYKIGESHINQLTFTQSDDLIIANTSKNGMLFINAQNGDLLELPDMSETIMNASLSPDNRYLAILHENGQISIWAIMNN